MMKWKRYILPAATAVLAVAVAVCAVVIAAKGMGLVDGYDFGAGAYYYADIPGFERFVDNDVYESSFPFWIYVAIFMLWGWAMYRLWIWIDRR